MTREEIHELIARLRCPLVVEGPQPRSLEPYRLDELEARLVMLEAAHLIEKELAAS